jgi:hypothetical protein
MGPDMPEDDWDEEDTDRGQGQHQTGCSGDVVGLDIADAADQPAKAKIARSPMPIPTARRARRDYRDQGQQCRDCQQRRDDEDP